MIDEGTEEGESRMGQLRDDEDVEDDVEDDIEDDIEDDFDHRSLAYSYCIIL